MCKSALIVAVIAFFQFVVMSLLLVEHLPLVDTLSPEVGMVGVELRMVGNTLVVLVVKVVVVVVGLKRVEFLWLHVVFLYHNHEQDVSRMQLHRLENNSKTRQLR